MLKRREFVFSGEVYSSISENLAFIPFVNLFITSLPLLKLQARKKIYQLNASFVSEHTICY